MGRGRAALGLLLVVVQVVLAAAALPAARGPPGEGSGWVAGPEAGAGERVALRLALRRPAGAERALEAALAARADPSSAAYGRWLTDHELRAAVAAPLDAVDELYARLGCGEEPSGAACRLSAHGDYVHATLPATRAGELFAAGGPVVRWSHASGATALRSRDGCDPAGVAAALSARAVERVDGICELPSVLPRRKPPGGEAPRYECVDPPTVARHYGLPPGRRARRATQAVAEFQQAFFYEADLNQFQRAYGLDVRNVTVVGPNDPDTGYLGEASLDVEYIMAVANGAETWAVSLDPFDMVAWALKVASLPQPGPRVHSVSFGIAERQLDAGYMHRANTEFMKLGLLGHSVVVASGDSGTGNAGWLRCTRFTPFFPASSPYVTTVGGTVLLSNETGDQAAWPSSGGGFSDTFGRPSYQEGAVQAYLSEHAPLPERRLFNASGRAYPDVAAYAKNFRVCIEGYCGGTVDGTSAASPTFAGVITLLNDRRLAAGKPTLGFLNPWLWGLAGGVGTDVTSGNNKARGCKTGFEARPGWDPVTGLGAPVYGTLAKQLP